MYIILRLFCETFSRIAVKLSFLWGHKHSAYAAALFQQMWHRDVHVTTRTFFLPLFCTSISYLSHSDCLVVILKFYTVPRLLHAVANFVNQKTFSSKHVSNFFYRENMTSFLNYVTATLRALFAWRGSYMYNLHPGVFLGMWTQLHICKS